MSVTHLLLLFECGQARLELLGKRVANARYSLQRCLEDLVGVQVGVRLGELDPDVADGLARVGHRVGAELDVLVLHDLVAHQVAERVVFTDEGVGRVGGVAGRVAAHAQHLARCGDRLIALLRGHLDVVLVFGRHIICETL